MIKAVFFAIAMSLVAPSCADEGYAEDLLRQKIWEGYSEGFAVRTATTAELNQDEYRIYLVTLYAGNTYRVNGVGDENVTNLDLVLHDADGNTVDYDKTEDAQPGLKDFTPSATATYFVVVHVRTVKDANAKAAVGMAVTFK
jgi:hypothetical protein